MFRNINRTRKYLIILSNLSKFAVPLHRTRRPSLVGPSSLSTTTAYNSRNWTGYDETMQNGEEKRKKMRAGSTRLKRKSPPTSGALRVFASWYAEMQADGGAERRVSFSGETLDVWQGSYLDVETFNGRCVTYREETPHSDVEAASNSHLACPSFYRGVIKYGEIHGSLPQETIIARLYQQQLVSRPDPPPPPSPPLVRFSVLGNFLHLVITCLRRNKRSKKMFLSSMFLRSYRRDPPFSTSLIDATTRRKIIVHRRLLRTGGKACHELSESTWNSSQSTVALRRVSIYITFSEHNFLSLTNFSFIINFHPFENSFVNI